MTAILEATNRPRLMGFAGVFGGGLVALFITVEAPLSGMSMNPARTVASAIPSGIWIALWVYLTAPVLGMVLAAETYQRTRGAGAVICAKLNHATHRRCIFNCGYRAHAAAAPIGTPVEGGQHAA
jgi:aquaporin Z